MLPKIAQCPLFLGLTLMIMVTACQPQVALTATPLPAATATASAGMALLLFARRRGWWWGLLPLGYAALIAAFTRDIWSAMAGFMWWGVIIAGFLVLGRGWWKGLALVTAVVLLTLILVPQSYTVFGLVLGAMSLLGGVWAGRRIVLP
jgi:hypothetical protein